MAKTRSNPPGATGLCSMSPFETLTRPAAIAAALTIRARATAVSERSMAKMVALGWRAITAWIAWPVPQPISSNLSLGRGARSPTAARMRGETGPVTPVRTPARSRRG